MDYFSGWCHSTRRLEGFTAIVTGSNSGIGKETAKDFYLRGARVIMACRDLTKAETAKKDIINNSKTEYPVGILVLEKLDLSSLKSVKEFAFRIIETEDNVNILVNNAGVMCCPEGRTEDGFETHMGTNHFGHALLTLLLLPKLIRSAPSRIVFVASCVHIMCPLDTEDMNYEKKDRYISMVAYSKSKSANILFLMVLARKLKEHYYFDVTTYSLHPGVINSGIGRHFSETMFPGASWAFYNIMGWVNKSPRCGAQTSIYCAVDESCGSQSGLYYMDCVPTPPSRYCQSLGLAERLWEVTIKSLQLENYNCFSKKDPDMDVFANYPLELKQQGSECPDVSIDENSVSNNVNSEDTINTCSKL